MIEAVTWSAFLLMLACLVAVGCRVAWPVVKALAGLMDDTWRLIRRMVLGPAPAALPPKVWCTCGSRAVAVPVEVHDAIDGPEVVAWLCPDCAEERRAPGEPVMTGTGPECHNCAEPWSMALDAPRDCDRCDKPSPLIPSGSKVPGWAQGYVCECGETGHKHTHPRLRPEPALERCAPGEHDWEEFEVRTHTSAEPVRTYRACLRCRGADDVAPDPEILRSVER